MRLQRASCDTSVQAMQTTSIRPPVQTEHRQSLTRARPQHGQMRLDLICIEGFQEGSPLVGPQIYPWPLWGWFTLRALPRALRHAPVGLHHGLQACVHLLRVHPIHHLRRHAWLLHKHSCVRPSPCVQRCSTTTTTSQRCQTACFCGQSYQLRTPVLCHRTHQITTTS